MDDDHTRRKTAIHKWLTAVARGRKEKGEEIRVDYLSLISDKGIEKFNEVTMELVKHRREIGGSEVSGGDFCGKRNRVQGKRK